MAARESQADVQCPFFHRTDNSCTITCEGIVDDSVIQLKYHTKTDRRQQMDLFCRCHYKKCEIYRMLMDSKYDGAGG